MLVSCMCPIRLPIPLRRFLHVLPHLTQKWRLCLHQCDDAVGEFVLDAAARAAEPRGDLPFLNTVDGTLNTVDVKIALVRRARQCPLLERHAVGRDIAARRSAVAREDIARREGDGDDNADRAVVGRVDGAPVVGVEARLAFLAEGLRHALLGGKLRDEFIGRRGEVVVHLPECGLLLLAHLCGGSGLSDGGGGVRADLRRDERGEDEECSADSAQDGAAHLSSCVMRCHGEEAVEEFHENAPFWKFAQFNTYII